MLAIILLQGYFGSLPESQHSPQTASISIRMLGLNVDPKQEGTREKGPDPFKVPCFTEVISFLPDGSLKHTYFCVHCTDEEGEARSILRSTFPVAAFLKPLVYYLFYNKIPNP